MFCRQALRVRLLLIALASTCASVSGHPQSDGLAERMVQMIKRALRRLGRVAALRRHGLQDEQEKGGRLLDLLPHDWETPDLVCGGGWDRPKASFKPGNYVVLK